MPETRKAPRNSPPLLDIDGMSQRLGGRDILREVSLRLMAGCVMGLIGLNGAGKTTMIKTVLGLMPTQKGKALIAGVPHERAESRAALMYLPEQFSPPPALTGMEMVRLMAGAYGVAVTRDEVRAKAALLALTPEALERKIKTYSKGMAQKLGLMGALLSRRSLLILDEPMSGLDPEARALLRHAMLAYRDEAPETRSILFSTHLLSDVEALCDRVAVMHEGRLVFEGGVAAFKQAHAGRDVEESFLHAIGHGGQQAA